MAGSTPRALESARAGARLGHAPHRGRRRGPCRLSRRRRHRRELPARWTAPPSASPPPPGSSAISSRRSWPPPSRTGRPGRRARAHRPDRARRRGDDRAPARRRSRSARPTCSTRFDALAAASRGPAARMRTIRTVAEIRAQPSPPAQRGARRPRADHGRLPRRPRVADARRPRGQRRVVVSLFVNPAQFNDPRDLDATRATRRRDARSPSAGADVLFAPAARGVYPPGSRRRSRCAASPRPRGRRSAARPLRGVAPS